MQQATASQTDSTRPPDAPPTRDYLPTRKALVRKAGGLEQIESVEQLCIASQQGRRTPWMLPPAIRRAWEAPVAPKLLLLFLGWLLEGSVRPRWMKGGLIGLDPTTRTVIGPMEDKLFLEGKKLAPGDWGNLLGCGGRQARRCVRVAEKLGLVEQVRNRAPARRELAELAAAYRPTKLLLDWLVDRRPPPELCLPEKEKMSAPQKSSPLLRGEEDLLKSEDLPRGGHEVEASPSAPETQVAASVGESPEPEAVGTVAVAKSTAPVGDERPAEGPQLLVAGVSARPAAPPAERPPGPFVDREELAEELAALARTLAGQLSLPRVVGPAPPPDELELRRREIKAQLARMKQREPDPPASDGSGGGA